MQTKPAKPAAKRTGKSQGKPKGRPGEARVATTIHITTDTLELISDAALAREIANVAKASHGQKVKRRDRDQCVAAVIEELIERHREELEVEGGTIRSSRTRRKAMEKNRQKQAKKGGKPAAKGS